MNTDTEADIAAKASLDALVVRAAEILREVNCDRENLAIRIARLEQRESAVVGLVEACKARVDADDLYTAVAKRCDEEGNEPDMVEARGLLYRANKCYVAALAKFGGAA